MEKLLTVEEAAVALRCEVCTIRRKVKAGLLAAYRNGKAFLISEQALMAYLEMNAVNKALKRSVRDKMINAAPFEK